MKNVTLLRAVVGSRMYGTNIETSDTDYKGIYMQDPRELLGFGYKEQYMVGKDETYYEIRRFLELAASANPTILELLNIPNDCIVTTSAAYWLLKAKSSMFLTKQCQNSFGGYAVAQIQKAAGLNKKMNWEKEKVTRKTPLDFCYIIKEGKTIELEQYLLEHNMTPHLFGLAKIDHLRDGYAVVYDWDAHFRIKPSIGLKGVCVDDSNSVRTSSFPKEMNLEEYILVFNKDAYSIHCKQFKDYEEWLEKRNTARYVDSQTHGQQIDGKNLMHCRRLLDMAIEIAQTGEVITRRPNREELLKIRRGEVKLDEVIAKAEEDIQLLKEVYAKCDLPKECDKNEVNELLLEIRDLWK